MDRFQLSRMFGAIKAFLLSKRSREALVFSFFLVISAGFWLMLTLNDEYDMEVEFPLALENVDEGTVITSDLPDNILVTLHDKGTTLLGYSFRLRRTALSVDFSAHTTDKDYAHVIVPRSEVQRLLQPFIKPSSRIVDISPDTVDYYYSRGVMRRVPVAFRGSAQVVQNHYLSRVSCDPDSVTVWGERDFLDSLTVVPTEITNFNNLESNSTRRVALTPMRGVKLEPAEVFVTAHVSTFVEKKVAVPIIGTNFPAGLTLRTFPAKATVSFHILADDYNDYDASNFVLTATYEELMQSPDSLLHLKLRSTPEGVSHVRISPESVQFLIEQTVDE